MLESPRFRDPPSVEVRVAGLEREIAQILLRAPELPLALPLFDVTLAGIAVMPDALEVNLVRDGARVATLRLSWPERRDGLDVQLRWDGPRRSPADQKALPVLAQRIQRSIDRERWAAARRLCDEVLDLPRHVPLEAFRMVIPGLRSAEGLVRTGFHCNQDCGLCWQGRRWGKVSSDQILTWIEDLRAAGATSLVVSGGEPTLDAALPSYLRRARELGFDPICLETNAIQMAKVGYAAKLVEAGLQRALVSLHSGDAATSDAITRAPGTHKRTILGIQSLLDAGVIVHLNVVLSTESMPTLARLPDYLRETFGETRLLSTLVVSDLGATFDASLVPGLLADPAAMRAVLPGVIDRATALGLRVDGLGGPCGPPPCMFGADPRVAPLAPIPGPVDFRRYVPACDGCAVKFACFGVRHAQVERFGEDLVQPILVAPT